MRFALELLTSHLGKHAVGDLSLTQGKEVLGYITQLSPNVRKYREGKDAGLADLARLAQEHESTTLAPQTQARILKQMPQFLDWCVGEGELHSNPWEALKVKDRPEVHPHGVLSDEQVGIVNPRRAPGDRERFLPAIKMLAQALTQSPWAVVFSPCMSIVSIISSAAAPEPPGPDTEMVSIAGFSNNILWMG